MDRRPKRRRPTAVAAGRVKAAFKESGRIPDRWPFQPINSDFPLHQRSPVLEELAQTSQDGPALSTFGAFIVASKARTWVFSRSITTNQSHGLISSI